MQPKYLQELIRNLQEFYKCPSCETNYHFDDIRFLGEVDLHCFVQLSCHGCSLPVLATVSVQDNGTIKKGSDFSTHLDQEKFSSKGEITASEIAEFHQYVTSSPMFFKRSNKD